MSLAKKILITTSVVFLSTQVLADNPPVVNLPAVATPVKQNIIIPQAPMIDAKAFILMDSDSGKIIAENNADTRLPPASMTKLMTLYVIFHALQDGQIHLDDKVRISAKAWQTGGSRMFVKAGDEVPVKDLIMGIIVDSGNDACVAMAEFIAGTEESFASLMNQQAARLGMVNSHFTDCNGLPDPNHYSSAHDMAILANAIIHEFPQYYADFDEKTFSYGGIKQLNRNRLLWHYQYADGLKTGHTEEAGFCLTASAKKDNMRLITVVMGAPTDGARADDSQALFQYGFRFYETHKIYDANAAIETPRVWKGEEENTPAGVMEPLFVTIPTGQYSSLKAVAAVNSSLEAPLKKGDTVGQITLTLGDNVIAKGNLVALADNPQGGIWTRMTDSISRSVHNMLHRNSDDDTSNKG